jgi:hypothetical protein
VITSRVSFLIGQEEEVAVVAQANTREEDQQNSVQILFKYRQKKIK